MRRLRDATNHRLSVRPCCRALVLDSVVSVGYAKAARCRCCCVGGLARPAVAYGDERDDRNHHGWLWQVRRGAVHHRVLVDAAGKHVRDDVPRRRCATQRSRGCEAIAACESTVDGVAAVLHAADGFVTVSTSSFDLTALPRPFTPAPVRRVCFRSGTSRDGLCKLRRLQCVFL